LLQSLPRRPIRVLELRSVRGTGGGPEKTILSGTARTDPSRYAITVCYLRDERDPSFGPAHQAESFDIDYVEVRERHSFDLRIWGTLRQLVRDRRADIVHAHDYKTDLIAWMLAKAEGVIPLSTAHGWAGDSWRERGYYWADKRLLRLYPRVVAVSSAIRDELIRTGASSDRVTVVLNGIDTDAFRRVPGRERDARHALGLPLDRFVVGAVGRLDGRKRYNVLMQAFAKLKTVESAPILVIAGEGPARGELEALVERLRLGDRCRLMGMQPDISLVHHAIDLFVQSSESEGTPNAVLEAMAFESPIVATNVGGTGELVTEGVDGLLIPPNDEDALRRALEQVMARPSEARSRALSARARVETELSFAHRMRRVEAIYDHLMLTDQFRPDPAAGLM
jgi:glycosyltransferase involved in cell wall biosynthesis